jgi:hypothetical protein
MSRIFRCTASSTPLDILDDLDDLALERYSHRHGATARRLT